MEFYRYTNKLVLLGLDFTWLKGPRTNANAASAIISKYWRVYEAFNPYITPRNCIVLTPHSKRLPLITTEAALIYFTLLLKIMYLELSTFKDSLFSVSHKAIFDSSTFTVLPPENTFVSSANIIGRKLVTFDISLLYKINSICPNIDP